jgi:hypothetical protein
MEIVESTGRPTADRYRITLDKGRVASPPLLSKARPPRFAPAAGGACKALAAGQICL